MFHGPAIRQVLNNVLELRVEMLCQLGSIFVSIVAHDSLKTLQHGDASRIGALDQVRLVHQSQTDDVRLETLLHVFLGETDGDFVTTNKSRQM